MYLQEVPAAAASTYLLTTLPSETTWSAVGSVNIGTTNKNIVFVMLMGFAKRLKFEA
ncbi:MAG: hypothetical protein MJE68_25950 [Proteobacteria bacterium]|nr:hypothetical protein [Pseudomonadota bacterium]